MKYLILIREEISNYVKEKTLDRYKSMEVVCWYILEDIIYYKKTIERMRVD